jgi:hypothetical protein
VRGSKKLQFAVEAFRSDKVNLGISEEKSASAANIRSAGLELKNVITDRSVN